MNLMVSNDGRYLTDERGEPFLWLGDTAWELLHRLTREETTEYLDVRARQGFNVVQTVLLAENDGVRTPNAYGRRPLRQNARGDYDPTLLDTQGGYSYWDHVDFVLSEAQKRGMVAALLPTWGDKYNRQCNGMGPELFSPENAFAYGRLLGQRYGVRENLVWVLGGDRHLAEERHLLVNRALAEGLKAGGAAQLMTFHPRGDASSSQYVGEERWLDFHMTQSGHGDFITKNWELIAADYARSPTKPVVEGEPKYEDHPPRFQLGTGFFDAFDTRKAAYWAMFSGALGVTYGHSCVWCMIREEERTDYHFLTWREALGRPGAENYGIMGRFLRAEGFPRRVPAQEALAYCGVGDEHFAASRLDDRLAVYSPYGMPIRLAPGWDRPKTARFFDPRTGEYAPARAGQTVRCPSSGRNCDWVLLLAYGEAAL